MRGTILPGIFGALLAGAPALLVGGHVMAQPVQESLTGTALSRLVHHSQGWGSLGINTCVKPSGRDAMPLRVRDREYELGFGHHANGELVFDLGGQYSLFECEAGVQWQQGTTGTVIFRVYVDDELRFDSGVVRESDDPVPVRVDVTGAMELRLEADDAGDGITCDCANWLNPRLTRNPDAAPPSDDNRVDIARFAAVCTWDPERMDGARSGRTQEMPAEDIFLATRIPASADATRPVPIHAGGVGCIGLQWVERRFPAVLHLVVAPPGRAPAPEAVQVQQWVGESWWQGRWQAMPGELSITDDTLTFRVDWAANRDVLARGVQQVRWLIRGAPEGLRVRSMSAFSRSRWETASLELIREAPIGEGPTRISIYNGEFLGPQGDGPDIEWTGERPLRLEVRYCRTTRNPADQTVLRVRTPSRVGAEPLAFGIAVADVVREGCVWAPAAGLFVRTSEGGPTAEECRARIAPLETVLERVRQMPDQSFEGALEAVHREVQNRGPTLLSLACDNHKFQVQEEGAVQFMPASEDGGGGAANWPAEVRPTLGRSAEGGRRSLFGGRLPVLELQREEGPVSYRSLTFVAPWGEADGAPGQPWIGRQPVCVVRMVATNPGAAPAPAALSVAFLAERGQGVAANLEPHNTGVVARHERGVLARADAGKAGPLEVSMTEGTLSATGLLGPGESAEITVLIPGSVTPPEALAALPPAEELLEDTREYWESIMSQAMQVSLPDALLTDVIRASQVHCLLAARNEAQGERISPWISSDRYGPLESEAHSIILGMSLMGHREFARRSLDFFIRRYNAEGYLTTGYTIMGTGWHLWTLARHFRLWEATHWLAANAPEIARVAEWIARQGRKTMREHADGTRPDNRGLMPPGVVADWGMYANRFYMDANMCAGLTEAARTLGAVGHAAAVGLGESAAAYRDAVMRAFATTQAATPVVRLRSGEWVPAAPGMVGCHGPVGAFYPTEDWGRTWATDVEIGPHHLAALGIMDPQAREAEWMMDYLEDHWCLQSGMGEYKEQENRDDWFNLGGFPKIQPYYGRMAQVHALRDDVKPFIRSYFNAIPSLLNLENLSFWEHFHNIGGWNKTHETGWFLEQTRTMLVMERGQDLWLAPFVTNHWMHDGMEVSVRNAPTEFGPVSYTIASRAADGLITATVEAPQRATPAAVIVRLRHPEGRRMVSVEVDGLAHRDFNAEQEWVRVRPVGGAHTIRAHYFGAGPL